MGELPATRHQSFPFKSGHLDRSLVPGPGKREMFVQLPLMGDRVPGC